MKKKLVLMCLTGMMIASISACGGKKADKDANVVETSSIMEENETTTVVEEESSDSAQTEIDRVSDREDYVGFQDLDIDKYVTLGDYKKMKVTATRPKVSEDGIEDYINSRLLVGTITNRPIKKGDVADIDYVGKKDGVAFEGGTASGYKLSIGSGGFNP